MGLAVAIFIPNENALPHWIYSCRILELEHALKEPHKEKRNLEEALKNARAVQCDVNMKHHELETLMQTRVQEMREEVQSNQKSENALANSTQRKAE